MAAPDGPGGDQCDVTSADVDALVDAAIGEIRPFDIMVNNAGITRDATMRKMTEDEFDQVISVHLKGTWNGLKKAAAIMRETEERRDREHVVDLGKVGMIGQTNYSAAKAGIVGMTKAASRNSPTSGCASTPSSPV